MNLSTDALVLRTQKIGDNDRLCTLLTGSHGLVRAFAKGACSIRHRNFSATAPLCYARFTLYSGRDRYIIDESETIDTNYSLRLDPAKLALSQYLCELVMQLAVHEEQSENFLRLLRGAFYYLCADKREYGVIKAAAEMRAMSFAGYLPDLVMCEECGAYTSERMCFFPSSGKLRCLECTTTGGGYPLEPSVLTALRHTVYADMKKLFSFTLPPEQLEALCEVCEKYVIEQTERTYRTLEIYHSL